MRVLMWVWLGGLNELTMTQRCPHTTPVDDAVAPGNVCILHHYRRGDWEGYTVKFVTLTNVTSSQGHSCRRQSTYLLWIDVCLGG